MTNKVRVLPVVVCAVAHFMLGAGWFTALSVPWLAGTGKTMEQLQQQGSTAVAYSTAFVASLAMAYVLARVIATGAPSLAAGIGWGLTLGIGVALAAMVTEMIFEAKPLFFMLITAGYPVVGMTLMGLILGAWKSKKATAGGVTTGA